MRDYKGKSVTHFIKDYSVVDLETTGTNIYNDSIIEISAIKVRDNKVVKEFSTLVNPMRHIPAMATAVNHITDDMVKNAPVLNDVIDSFIDFVGDDTIVGYNNAAFDMNMLYDCIEELRNIHFSNGYIDILHSVRKYLADLERHNLECASKHYGLDTTGEHRALKDCYLTKDVYDNLYKEFGDEAFYRKNNSHSCGQKYSEETLAIRELQNILKEIIKDGEVSVNEVFFLKNWMEDHYTLRGNYPFDRVYDSLEKVLADGIITDNERFDLQVLFTEYIDPVNAYNCDIDEDIVSIEGNHFCLTGEFSFGTRDDVCKYIEKAGGVIDKSTKKSTNYVVVGSLGSDNWKTEKYGSKIQKALEWNKKGSDISIIKENQLMQLIRDSLKYKSSKPSVSEDVIEPVDDEEYDENISDGNENWQNDIQLMLDNLIKEMELPEKSMYLKTNYSKKNPGVITSYTVAIWEPDYPPKSRVIVSKNGDSMNIKEKNDSLELIIDQVQYGDIGICPEDSVIKNLKSDPYNIHIIIKKDSDKLIEFVETNTRYALARYTSKADRFGCCSRFIECSDAKRCLHENKLYSKACMYRSHLEAGHIFYGKNKNIDSNIKDSE